MKFKIDENLPVEAADILRGAGFVADTVRDQDLSGADDETIASTSRAQQRILVTLDLDFANIRAYPPGEHAGIIVLRVKRHDKSTVLAYIRDWQQRCRIETRQASCGLSMGIESAFDRVVDRSIDPGRH